MYNKILNDGWVTIQNSLTENEIIELTDNVDLKCIFLDDEADIKTLQLLNKILFFKRKDVTFKIFWLFPEFRSDLTFLNYLTNVSKLNLFSYDMPENIDSICKLDKLDELTIDIYNLDSFDFIKYLPVSIQSLSLCSTKKRTFDLKVLERFKYLNKLFIEGHTKNIDIISKLEYLEDLTLKSISTNNLEFLKPLKKLWSLDVKLGGIKDFSAIKDMVNIKYLELWQIRGLDDLSFISSMYGLQNLFLQSLTNVKSLPPLNNLTNLKKIYIENMKNLKDINCLEFIPNLIEFIHYSAINMKVEDYLPLLRNKSLKRASVLFGSDKKNNEFIRLSKIYKKDDDNWWIDFPYENN